MVDDGVGQPYREDVLCRRSPSRQTDHLKHQLKPAGFEVIDFLYRGPDSLLQLVDVVLDLSHASPSVKRICSLRLPEWPWPVNPGRHAGAAAAVGVSFVKRKCVHRSYVSHLAEGAVRSVSCEPAVVAPLH